MGVSLLLPGWVSLFIFAFLGLGMAAPFVALCYSPPALSLLPRPGAWMEKLKKVLSLPVFATSAWLIWVIAHQAGVGSIPAGWERYDEASIERARSEDRPVFIDVTAAWCITCQWNKKSVLETSPALNLFHGHKVLLYQADWTNKDPLVTNLLAKYRRNSVPLYIFLPPKGETILLPELLSIGDIQKLFFSNETYGEKK